MFGKPVGREVYSPRTRGCSHSYHAAKSATSFSPRTRGCSQSMRHLRAGIDLFPAYAGLFPQEMVSSTLLHLGLRGSLLLFPALAGLILATMWEPQSPPSFPRPRGVVPPIPARRSCALILPCVRGVDPSVGAVDNSANPLPPPHPRGFFLSRDVTHTIFPYASSSPVA